MKVFIEIVSDGEVSYFCVLGVIVQLGINVENYSFNTKASKIITKLVNLFVCFNN